MPVIIRVNNRSNNPLPAYATEGASGMDIAAYVKEPIVLHPMQWHAIPTGLYVEIPPGYEIQLRPRSGLAKKYGITLLNAPATIDSDYRGEIQVLLINLGKQPFEIYNGMRIAQMVVAPVVQIQWQVVEQLTPTQRGSGGFGSTGI